MFSYAVRPNALGPLSLSTNTTGPGPSLPFLLDSQLLPPCGACALNTIKEKKDVCTAFNPSFSSATLFDLGVFLGHLVTHVFLANLFKRVQLETCDRLQKFARCSFVSVGGSCLGPSSPFIFLSSVSFVIILYFYSTLSFILLLFRKTTSARHANVFRLGCNSFSYISIVFP